VGPFKLLVKKWACIRLKHFKGLFVNSMQNHEFWQCRLRPNIGIKPCFLFLPNTKHCFLVAKRVFWLQSEIPNGY
jgi:hypothetical protein